VAIVAVFEDNTETVERLHKDLDDTGLQVRETGLARGFAANIEKDGPAGLIVGAVEKVSLLERFLGMRCVSRF
jgi:hypothetical protein